MNYNESEENKAFEMGLRIAGITTDPYTRDIIMKMADAAKELKSQMTIMDISKIEADCCETHGYDINTKEPVRHEGKKIFIAKMLSGGGHEYYTPFGQIWTKDIKDAHDFKTFAWAEKMIVEKEHKGVIILPYYE
jgi:GH43 family beta-xylosidase